MRETQIMIGQAINIAKDLTLHNYQGQVLPVEFFNEQLKANFVEILFNVNQIKRDAMKGLLLSDQAMNPVQPQPINNQGVPPPQFNQQYGVNQQ